MNTKKKRRHSLFKKLIIPLIVVTLIQSFVFFYATFYGGISNTINQNAEDVLKERVINQERGLETLFSTQWANFSTPVGKLSDTYQELSEAYGGTIYQDRDAQKKFLSKSVNTLIQMIRSGEVTGAFLILNDEKEFHPLVRGQSQNKYGICIRDYDPSSEYKDKEDLMVTRCPSALTSTTGCAVDNIWEATYTFDEKTPGNYYYKPMELAYENPGSDNTDLAYFDSAHSFTNSDRPVVSYSLPLMDESGYPYGVLGIELTTDYVKSLIPASTLYGNNAGCYALVQYQEGDPSYQVLAYNGVLFQQCFGSEMIFSGTTESDGMLRISGKNSEIPMCGSISDIQIYNHNTPYENERLALVGMVREDALYGINTIVRNRLLLVSALVLVLGMLAVLIISRRLTKPIDKLSQKVRGMDAASTIELERLNIDEIDDLVESIEELSDKVSHTAIRTEFFSRMSHDMRTPMNAIIGFSSPEFTDEADEAMLRDYLTKIHQSGGYLLTLINEVLDMSKIEMQRMELREEVTTQRELLETVAPIISEVAKKKNVEFVMDTTGADTAFYCDGQRLKQVIVNLLSNAVKFSEPGGKVLLRMKELQKTTDSVVHRIVIKDNGCGMSEEFQKKMYEPFSQEGNSKNVGTGLGLAIARQMVTLMGGTMSCKSGLGEGTTFEVTITNRLAQEPNRNSLEVKEEQRKPEVNMAGRRVLLCEDHPLNAQIAQKLLEREGILVEHAQDGEEGVSMFRQSEIGYYDLILMDIRMPRLNGLEATEAIRKLDREDARKIPIVAMTANAFQEDVEKSREAGMNEHLSKPIDTKILHVTLEKYLGGGE